MEPHLAVGYPENAIHKRKDEKYLQESGLGSVYKVTMVKESILVSGTEVFIDFSF